MVIQPNKEIYIDPLTVLDFQSLYPSIIIAYNICYSTCIGRIDSLYDTQNGHYILKK